MCINAYIAGMLMNCMHNHKNYHCTHSQCAVHAVVWTLFIMVPTVFLVCRVTRFLALFIIAACKTDGQTVLDLGEDINGQCCCCCRHTQHEPLSSEDGTAEGFADRMSIDSRSIHAHPRPSVLKTALFACGLLIILFYVPWTLSTITTCDRTIYLAPTIVCARIFLAGVNSLTSLVRRGKWLQL